MKIVQIITMLLVGFMAIITVAQRIQMDAMNAEIAGLKSSVLAADELAAESQGKILAVVELAAESQGKILAASELTTEAQKKNLRELKTEIVRLRNDVTTQDLGAEDLVGTTMESQLRRVAEIDSFLAQVDAEDPAQFARAIAEIDSWMFHPDDEKGAQEAVGKLVEKLRVNTSQAIEQNLAEAVKARSGNLAAGNVSKASELLRIFPNPTTAEQQAQVDAMSSQIVATSRRVEELRKLRYNAWVAGQVRVAIDEFYNNKKMFGDDDVGLRTAFVQSLGSVDTSYLDPAVSSIYQQILTTTLEALSEPSRVKLAQSLNSISIQRKTPFDF